MTHLLIFFRFLTSSLLFNNNYSFNENSNAKNYNLDKKENKYIKKDMSSEKYVKLDDIIKPKTTNLNFYNLYNSKIQKFYDDMEKKEREELKEFEQLEEKCELEVLEQYKRSKLISQRHVENKFNNRHLDFKNLVEFKRLEKKYENSESKALDKKIKLDECFIFEFNAELENLNKDLSKDFTITKTSTENSLSFKDYKSADQKSFTNDKSIELEKKSPKYFTQSENRKFHKFPLESDELYNDYKIKDVDNKEFSKEVESYPKKTCLTNEKPPVLKRNVFFTNKNNKEILNKTGSSSSYDIKELHGNVENKPKSIAPPKSLLPVPKKSSEKTFLSKTSKLINFFNKKK